MDKTPVMYLAGPMATPEQLARFAAVQRYYEDNGWNVINPTFHVPRWMERPPAIRICLDYIDRADVVVLLLGWRGSRGAQLEYEYARYIGKEVRFLMGDGTLVLDAERGQHPD